MMTSQPILTKTSVSIVNQTKKLIDYRRQEGKHAGLYINGATVDMVNSFKFLGVRITQDFACNIQYIYGPGGKKQNKTKKQAQQCLFILRWQKKYTDILRQVCQIAPWLSSPHQTVSLFNQIIKVTSSIDDFLPGLRLQHSVVRVKVLTNHEDDHGNRYHPQQGHVPPRQQGGTGQDGWGVDAGQSTVHERYPWGKIK